MVGSHSGVEIGADGPCQMGLEDIAMLRAVHASTVLYPSDATSTVALVEAMAITPGISYLFTHHPRRLPRPLLRRRKLPHWRLKSTPIQRPGRRNAHRRRRHPACLPQRRGNPAERRRPRTRHRLLFCKAYRHRHPQRGGRRHFRSDCHSRRPPLRRRTRLGRYRLPARGWNKTAIHRPPRRTRHAWVRLQ